MAFKLVLALFDGLVEALQGDEHRVRLPVAQLLLGLRQAGYRLADIRVHVDGGLCDGQLTVVLDLATCRPAKREESQKLIGNNFRCGGREECDFRSAPRKNAEDCVGKYPKLKFVSTTTNHLNI